MAGESKAALRKRQASKSQSSSDRLSEREDVYTRESLAPVERVEIESVPSPKPSVLVQAETTEAEPAPKPSGKAATGAPSQVDRKPKGRPKRGAASGPFADRPAPMTIFSLNITVDLWNRYEELAVEMTELGRQTEVPEVIRLVLANSLPDLKTDEGKAEAFRIASDWGKKRTRQAATPANPKIRLRVPMVAEIKKLSQEARRAGARLEASRLICGLLDESSLEAKDLIELEEG